MRFFLFLMMVFFSVNVSAANAWYFGLTVKDLRAQSKANQTSFRTLEAINNPGGCPSGDYYVIRPDNNPQLAMSILLAAFMGNKKIDIYVVDYQCGVFSRPSVTDVRIRN